MVYTLTVQPMKKFDQPRNEQGSTMLKGIGALFIAASWSSMRMTWSKTSSIWMYGNACRTKKTTTSQVPNFERPEPSSQNSRKFLIQKRVVYTFAWF